MQITPSLPCVLFHLCRYHLDTIWHATLNKLSRANAMLLNLCNWDQKKLLFIIQHPSSKYFVVAT